MTSLSVSRTSSSPRAGTPAIAKLGVLVVALAATIVVIAAGAVLLSAVFSIPAAAPAERGDAVGLDVLGALFFGAIAIAAVVEAVRLAGTIAGR